MHNNTRPEPRPTPAPRNTLRELLLAAALPLGLTAAARAATDTYSAPSGNWSDPANWSLGRIPINTDTVFLTNGPNGNFGDTTVSFDPAASTGTGVASVTIQGTNGGTVTLSQSANTFNVTGTEYLGHDTGTSGALSLSAGSHHPANLYLGYSPGSTGNVTISSSGSLNLSTFNSLQFIGYFGTGSLDQHAGGNVGQTVYLAFQAGSLATYNLDAGNCNFSNEYVGYRGTATFTQIGGANTIATLQLTNDSASQGTYSLSAGTLTVTSAEVIGSTNNVTAAFNQTGGTHSVTGYIYLGSASNGSASYTLSAGRLTADKDSHIGIGGELIGANNGAGTFTQTGGINSTHELTLGFTPGTAGTYNMSGGSLDVAANEVVGYTGASTFNQSGGTHSVSATFKVGSTAPGTFNLSGDGSLTVTAPSFAVGDSSIGLSAPGLFTQSGGSFNMTGSLSLGTNVNGRGTNNLSAGTLVVGTSERIAISGQAALLQTGGAHYVNGTGTNGLFLAQNPASTGTATLSGGLLSVASSEYVGYRGNATFTQTGGTHTIGSALIISANPGTSTGSFNLQGGSLSAAALTINQGGSLTQTGGTLTIPGPATNHNTLSLLAGTANFGPLSGTGSLTVGSPSATSTAFAALPSFSQSSLTIDSTGKLTVSLNSPRATNTARTLIINPGGTLDLTRNDLLLDRTLTPPSTLRSSLLSGYNNNSWTGSGITSSLAQGTNANTFSLGWADLGADPNPNVSTPTGATTNQILVRYTLRGDANLDGKVDIQDLLRFRSNAGTTNQAQWWQGDFTYDGKVDIQDLLAFRATAGAPPVPSDVTMSDLLADTFDYVSTVPEPAATSLLGLGGALALLARRRRHAYP